MWWRVAWTDLPRDSLPNLVNLFGKAANASVKHFRVVPPTYPSWLTNSEVTKIRIAIAKLLGVAPPPTPTPSLAPTPAPTLGPTPTAAPIVTPAPTNTPPPTPAPSPPPSAVPS